MYGLSKLGTMDQTRVGVDALLPVVVRRLWQVPAPCIECEPVRVLCTNVARKAFLPLRIGAKQEKRETVLGEAVVRQKPPPPRAPFPMHPFPPHPPPPPPHNPPPNQHPSTPPTNIPPPTTLITPTPTTPCRPYLGQTREKKSVVWTRSTNNDHFSPISSATLRRQKPTWLSLLVSFLQ